MLKQMHVREEIAAELWLRQGGKEIYFYSISDAFVLTLAKSPCDGQHKYFRLLSHTVLSMHRDIQVLANMKNSDFVI